MARCAECPVAPDENCDEPCGISIDHPKLRETGNEPTVSYEEALLREQFGEADDDGVYGGVSDAA